MDWHPATVSRRGKTYYVSMTVPKEARDAVGANQVRRSTGTTDKRHAEKMRCDLEVTLRQTVLQKLQEQNLSQPDSPYQTAVRVLKLQEQAYSYSYNAEMGDVILRRMTEVPHNQQQALEAAKVLDKVELRFKAANLMPLSDAENIKHLERFDLNPPSADEVSVLVQAAKKELEGSFGDTADSLTISGFLPEFETLLDRRVANESIRQRSRDARVKHVHQFAETAKNPRLADVEARHAYDFAKQLDAEGLARRTIQTRVSDVTTLLEAARQEGHITTNPFHGLKLANFGTMGQNYTPFTDELLHTLFSIPGLPKEIRDIWAVLVCTGMRLDEVALCKVRQVQESEGILFFDLRHAVVKNSKSQRIVPVCRTVEALIQSRTEGKKPEDRLFDFALKATGKSRASEKCLYWMKKVDFQKLSGDPHGRYTTHSLRGTLKDKLRDAEVGYEVNNALLGHDQGGVGSSYGRGPSLRAKKDAIDRPAHPYLHWIEQEYG